MFTSKKIPVNRGMYAVLKGTYGGEFIVYIKESLESYVFLSLPSKTVMDIPKKSFINGIEEKIIDFVKKLPQEIYKTVELEFSSINIKNGTSTTKTNNKPYKRGTYNTEDGYFKDREKNSHRGALDLSNLG
jgi:hypothetical protein